MKKHEQVRLPPTIPGIGPLTASIIVATIDYGKQFCSGRDLAGWIGLTPLNKSSRCKEFLRRTSHMGNHSVRATCW
ncbi:MAG: transposase [Rhizobiaceae bacterium]